MMREKRLREINPILLNLGIISSAFSVIGICYSVFKSTSTTNNPSGSSTEIQSDQSDSCMGKDEFRSPDNDYLLKTLDFGNADLILSPEEESPSQSGDSVQINESASDKNVYLLPEFNELLKERDLAKDSYTSKENADHEVEIAGLRNTIGTLNERIRSLEFLEYNVIKEQESYVMELQNRLKINRMESRTFYLKSNALMADKKRLEEQMADYSKVGLELQTANSKIKELTREAHQNKAYILALGDIVTKLQGEQLETNDLEESIEELKKYNHSLVEENSALYHKVEYLQNFATCALEDEQVEGLKKESICLRQQNEDLASQIERLEAAHCIDVEELVYLRWINAQRNHTPGTGKTAAQDQEYAQKGGGLKDKADFDLEQWSSSLSYLTEDSSSSTNNQSDTTKSSKIFGKLGRLVRRKQGTRHRQSSSSSETSLCIDSKVRRCFSDIRSITSSEKPNKLSFNLESFGHFHFQESTSPKGEKSNYIRCRRNSHDGYLPTFNHQS